MRHLSELQKSFASVVRLSIPKDRRAKLSMKKPTFHPAGFVGKKRSMKFISEEETMDEEYWVTKELGDKDFSRKFIGKRH